MIYFSKNIKYLRKINKISQTQLANILNVHRQQIAHYESSKNRPSFEMLVKIKEYLNINLDDLLFKDLENEKEKE